MPRFPLGRTGIVSWMSEAARGRCRQGAEGLARRRRSGPDAPLVGRRAGPSLRFAHPSFTALW